MGVLSAFDLIATARSQGLDLAERDGKLRLTGPTDVDTDLLEQLRTRRDDILGALGHSPGICAHCGGDQIVLRTWHGDEPYCRPCAQRVGLELLAEEGSWVLERQAPTLDDTAPPAPPGYQADPAGNIWKLRCGCGLHTPSGKGHDAQPVNYVPPAEEAS